MPKGLLLISLLLIDFFNASGQTVINGHIYDLATGADLYNVEVRWKSNTLVTKSNFSGDFTLIDVQNENNELQFFHNTIFWNKPLPFEINIHNLNGQTIISDHNTSDRYLIADLQPGVYVMSLELNAKKYHFKLLSNGSKTVKVDKKRGMFHINESTEKDTLIIFKEGYLTREVPIQINGKILEIPLMKGNYDKLDYFNELIAPLAFDMISGSPSRTNRGNVKEVKIIYDTEEDEIYYMNSSKYELHYSFAEKVLNYEKGLFFFNNTQYRENPARYLHLASINHYEAINQYALQFTTAVDMTCQQIDNLYQKILNTSFLTEDLLGLFAIKNEWKACAQIKQLSAEELYEGQVYQGLNICRNYGYLRRISSEDLPNTYFGRHDIIITDGVPNDLPVVAGIITSEFQTPLSHINVLSHSRNTPNMALRGVWDSTFVNNLQGKLILLDVKNTSFEIREASIAEASNFWSSNEPNKEIVLSIDRDFDQLVDLNNANHTYLNRIGGKAANFAELLNVNTYIPVPEGPQFAIPFHYYLDHLKTYGLDLYVTEMLENPLFKSNIDTRNQYLQNLRDSIISSPIDINLLSRVKSKIRDFQDFDSYRFRSSTNAEDLEDFSGAGLYDSYSAKKNHDTKTIENAIKKVWASLWNLRAFEEREYFKINHQSCAMGILVHRSFPDENANGVLITKNLYNKNPGFTINVQYGEYSIVYPEPGVLHDQMLLFTWSIDPNEEFMLEYLTFSNLPELNGKTVLTKEEVFELGHYAKAIKRRFYYELPHNCDCTYDDFGVDIEFKVDSEVSPRKIYIKQARRYK